jgi:hypothetical protein
MEIAGAFLTTPDRGGALMDDILEFPAGGRRAPDIEENPRGADDRVAIQISSDNIAETVTEVEDSVRALRLPLYRRGSLIVRAGLVSEKLPDGSAQVSLLSPSARRARDSMETKGSPTLNMAI